MHDPSFALEIVGLLGLYGLMFVAIELLNVKEAIDLELARKSTHIVGGFLAASLPIFLDRWQIVVVGVLMAAAMIISKRYHLLSSIHHRGRIGYGEVWFPLGIALLAIIEPSNDLRFVCGALVLGLSDAMASIMGLRYGRRKYFLVDKHWKTYLGSSVFFATSLLIFAVVFHVLAGLPIVGHLWQFSLISLVLTLLEAVSSKGYDNIVLPLSTALLLHLFGLH